jgi:hypothetical protein
MSTVVRNFGLTEDTDAGRSALRFTPPSAAGEYAKSNG